MTRKSNNTEVNPIQSSVCYHHHPSHYHPRTNPGFAALLYEELRKSGGLNGSDRKAFKSFNRSAKALTRSLLKEVKRNG